MCVKELRDERFKFMTKILFTQKGLSLKEFTGETKKKI